MCARCASEQMLRPLPVSTMARWVGGQRCNTAMKSMIHGSLDVTNKLSCHLILKQKRWRGGNWESTVHWSRSDHIANVQGLMPVWFSVGSVGKKKKKTPRNIHAYTSTLRLYLLSTSSLHSLSPRPLSLSAWNLPPNAARLSHLCRKWIVSQSPQSQGFTCKECSFIGWTD